MPVAGADFDHPIFRESLRIIRAMPGMEAALGPLTALQQDVVLRLIHSSGDPELAGAVRFSPGACEAGLAALALREQQAAVAQGMAAADFALLYLAYGDLVAGLERAQ
jgi:precorrin isomerase